VKQGLRPAVGGRREGSGVGMSQSRVKQALVKQGLRPAVGGRREGSGVGMSQSRVKQALVKQTLAVKRIFTTCGCRNPALSRP